MAVKASASITLSSVRDLASCTRYYLLQSSTLAPPARPSASPPGGSWVTAEPSYTTGSTNSLYFCDLNVFSDGDYAYSEVSLSSSYEAAKAAYNAAQTAQETARQALSNTEVVVGTQTRNTSRWTGRASFAQLLDGQQIVYWLPYAYSSSDYVPYQPTGGSSANGTGLNLTLADGTETGFVPCFYGGESRITSHYGAGCAVRLLYRTNVVLNGHTYAAGWWADANYDSNNYDRIRFNNNVKAKTAITASRVIVGDSAGYFHLAAGSVFDADKPILWAGSNISANATGSNNYLSFPGCTLRNNAGSSWTAAQYATLYLAGTLNGRTFTVAAQDWLTTAPADGSLTYVSLGYMYSTYQMYLYPEHPMYRIVDGALKAVSQIACEAMVAAESAQDAVEALDDALTQQEIFNRLTDNGAAQGLVLYNGQLYVNASYIQSGMLTLGGANNVNGQLRVLDGSGGVIGTWNSDGITLNKGAISGPSVTLGGSGNVNGQLQVMDASGTVISTMNNTGIDILRGSIQNFASDGYFYNALEAGGLRFYVNMGKIEHGDDRWERIGGMTGALNGSIGAFKYSNIGLSSGANLSLSSNEVLSIYTGGTSSDRKIRIYTNSSPGAQIELSGSSVSIDGDTSFSGTVAASAFSGPLTGNVTGSCTGTAANVTGTVEIGHGGTGATTAANARANLGITPANIGAVSSGDIRYVKVNQSDATPGYTGGGERFYKAAMKYICENYAYANLFEGYLSPNSRGPYIGNIYSVSDVDSTTGLPRYSTFVFHNVSGGLESFGTINYEYYHRQYVYNTGTWGISITGNAANVTGTVAVGHGGTGATTAANARENLGIHAGRSTVTFTNGSGSISFSTLGVSSRPSALVLTAQTTQGVIFVYDHANSSSEAVIKCFKANSTPVTSGLAVTLSWICIP